MDLIVADKDGIELGDLVGAKELDIDIGDTNDFELTISLSDFKSNDLDYEVQLFSPNTEYGGIVEDIESATKNNTLTLRGDTWRGMLDKKVIEPPEGLDYLVVEGELNALVLQLVESKFDNLFRVASGSTGITITFQFERYTTLLEGIKKMLSSVGYRLRIQYIQGGAGENGVVELSAVQIMNYSNEIEYSQDDGKINFSCRDKRNGINHLICLGKGELAARMVKHLYVQENGTIGATKFYTGKAERTDIYDYSSAESEADLVDGGTKRLKELMNYQKFEVDINDMDVEPGDIVGGRDRITGIKVSKPVVTKILKIENNKLSTTYKLKGEN